MPRLLIELMMLIYRFVFILLHTASAIMTAQEARLGNRDYRTQLRAFGKMLTALFFISLRKANALYDAMEDAEQASALMREHLLTPIPIIQQAMAGKLSPQAG